MSNTVALQRSIAYRCLPALAALDPPGTPSGSTLVLSFLPAAVEERVAAGGAAALRTDYLIEHLIYGAVLGRYPAYLPQAAAPAGPEAEAAAGEPGAPLADGDAARSGTLSRAHAVCTG